MNFIKMIAPETEISQGMFDTIINFTPSEFAEKLWSIMSVEITNTVCIYIGVFKNVWIKWAKMSRIGFYANY